jgi:hypothetical protein
MNRRIAHYLILSLSLSATLQAQTTGTDNFSPELRAQLMEEGEAQLLNGDLTRADLAFTRLFETVRASQGLYYPGQLPALERLLTVTLAQGDTKRFTQYLEFHEHLSTHLYLADPRQLAGEWRRSADWHRAAAQNSIGERRSWHLIRARNMLWRAVSNLETLTDAGHELADLMYQITLSHHTLTFDATNRGRTSLEVRTDQPLIMSGWAYTGAESERISYEIGLELLQRIALMYDGNAAPVRARLQTYLGDWQLLFGRRDWAMSHYTNAIAQLANHPASELVLTELFGQPTYVPLAALNLDGMQPQLTAVTGGQLRPELDEIMQAAASPSGFQLSRDTSNRPPSAAEVEQYNAIMPPHLRLICRSETPVGSNIAVRSCQRASDADEASAFHREQLRRALR